MIDLIPADVFDTAADLIRANGLHKGDYYDDDRETEERPPEKCAMCAMGAINAALTGDPVVSPWQDAYDRARELHTIVERFLDVEFLSDWNDADERTAEDVAAALEGAAQAWRERVR